MNYLPKTYKAIELIAVLDLLQNNNYHNFSYTEAKALITMLSQNEYRIVKTGVIKTGVR